MIKDVSETIQNEAKNQKGGFHLLAANLLGGELASKGVIRASEETNVLKVWRMRYLNIEGKINVFKSLIISKIIYLTLVTLISTYIINHLNTIQRKISPEK